ncbi:ArsR/SmtB family transcription factor [Thermococcus gorgonarius]|uniref:Transcriptional regulator n=1 Tax=Thermococcus gorgonarius TaxID=71997 RepID=A0A2Z2M7L3_THEGO|nr:metalloregulator ArsR/SmtB family transcription factor [Thermococcus gorgonarius]ASJ01279.1 transcriptional regulator [Thermococcus gorgonarius]
MKVVELIEGLNEKQKKSVEKCIEKCNLLNPEEEISVEIEKNVLDFVKVLSNPLRFSIIKMLRNRWLCVCLIAKALGQDQTLISHHLRRLKELGLVEERREGKLRFYRTNEDTLRKYFDDLKNELGL